MNTKIANLIGPAIFAVMAAAVLFSLGLTPDATGAQPKRLAQADLTVKNSSPAQTAGQQTIKLEPPKPENNTFTFQSNGAQAATIDGFGKITCIGKPIAPAEAYKLFQQYAAIYLSACNPPAKK